MTPEDHIFAVMRNTGGEADMCSENCRTFYVENYLFESFNNVPHKVQRRSKQNQCEAIQKQHAAQHRTVRLLNSDPLTERALSRAGSILNTMERIINKPNPMHLRRTKYERPIVSTPSPEEFFAQHKKCYKKEAKAMLEGKHWEGKNKCVTLIGD